MANPFASPKQLKPDGTIVSLSAPFDYGYSVDFKVWIPSFGNWPNPGTIPLGPATVLMGGVRLNDSARTLGAGPNTGFSLVWVLRYPADNVVFRAYSLFLDADIKSWSYNADPQGVGGGVPSAV